MAANWIYILLQVATITIQVLGQSENFTKYNDQTDVCCNGIVSKKLPVQQRCCGSIAYSVEEHLCCGKTLHPIQATNDSQWACCFDSTTNMSQVRVYNAKTHQCCSGEVLKKPEAGKMYECCEGHLYAARTERCCGKRVVKLQQGFDCCGNEEVYDTLTKTCCRAAPTVNGSSIQVPYKLHDKDGIRKCCGLELYDASANYCCNRTVFPLKKDMLGNEDHPETCCGEEIMPHNLKNPLCYHGHWWERNSTDLLVCNGELFNFKEGICCGNQTLARTSGLSCCWSAELPYDQKTHTCCGTQIVPLSNEDLQQGVTSCCNQWHQ